jgi:hypothetical protein
MVLETVSGFFASLRMTPKTALNRLGYSVFIAPLAMIVVKSP